MVNEDKIEELLFTLVEDVSYIKGRMDSLDEIKANQKSMAVRQDRLEANLAETQNLTKSLHARQNTLESEMRESMRTSKDNMDKAVVSVGICILSAVLSLVSAFLLK